jgi:hypothetical protein
LNRNRDKSALLWVLRWHVWLVATAAPVLVRMFSLRRLLGLLTPASGLRPYAHVPPERISEMVRRRLERPRNMRRRACLREGLVLFHFLRLAGLPAELHVGIYPPSSDPRRLHGHCWVTVGGQCFSSPPGSPAAEMAEFGGQESAVPEIAVLPRT